MKKLFLIFLFLLISCPAWGVTKTVCESGCDYTTVKLALSGYAFQPDDIIEMRADTAGGTKTFYDTAITWTSEDQGTSGHPVTLQGRTGDTIILSGGVDTTGFNSGWIDDGDNVWHRTVSSAVGIVVYNGATLTKDTDTTPTLNKWYWASNVLYVNVGGDPSSTISWKVGKNSYPLLIQADYVSLKNFIVELGNSTFGGPLYIDGQTGINIDNVEVRYGNAYGFYADTCIGCVYNRMIVHDFYSNHGVWLKGGSSTFKNGTVYNIGSFGTNQYNGIYLLSQVSVIGGSIYNINGSAIYVPTAGSGSKINGVTIYNAGCKNTDGTLKKYGAGAGGGGILLTYGASNITGSNNFIFDSTQGISISTTTGTGGNIFFYNIVSNSTVNGIGDYNDGNPTNRNVFYNNTVFHSPSADNSPAYTGHGFHVQDLGGGGGKATFANNACYNAAPSSASHCFFINDNGGLSSVYADYNIWYSVVGGINTKIQWLGSYTDLATWKTAVQGNAHFAGLDGVQSHAESHSLFSDPLFISATNYHLQSGSPAKGAGVDVGLSNTNPPDIGAEPYKQYVPWR